MYFSFERHKSVIPWFFSSLQGLRGSPNAIVRSGTLSSFVFRFLRSMSAKTEIQIKRPVPCCRNPELVEGQAIKAFGQSMLNSSKGDT
jgi:hypothetical protein